MNLIGVVFGRVGGNAHLRVAILSLCASAFCGRPYEKDEWALAAIAENEKLDMERGRIRKKANEYPGSGPLGSTDPYDRRESYLRDMLMHLVSQMMNTAKRPHRGGAMVHRLGSRF